MVDFFQTVMGKRFYEGTMPKIAEQLERIADQLEKKSSIEEVEVKNKNCFEILKTNFEEQLIQTLNMNQLTNKEAKYMLLLIVDQLDTDVWDIDK